MKTSKKPQTVKKQEKPAIELSATPKQTRAKRLDNNQAVTIPKTRQEYQALMDDIEKLVAAGNGTILPADTDRYQQMALAAQAYEQKVYTIDMPTTLEGILEWAMYEQRMKQKDLAKKLGVSDAKLSLVISGKQRPDVALLKSMHDNLGIDGNLLLSAV